MVRRSSSCTFIIDDDETKSTTTIRRLQESLGWPPKRAAAALRYLTEFARRCGYGSDYTALSGAREDVERAVVAWEGMRRDGRWSPKHTARVRGWLAAALRLLVGPPALVAVVHPAATPLAPAVRFLAPRSHDGSFVLHDCLPLRVRRLGSQHVDYRLLARLADECAAHLRSVSRGHLQRMCGLLDALLHHHSDPPFLLSSSSSLGDDDVDGRWRWLATRQARHWMRRYGEVMLVRRRRRRHDGEEGGGLGLISFDHFKRHMRLLAIIHGKVFQPDAKVTVPIPSSGGRIHCSEALWELSSCASSSSAASRKANDDDDDDNERHLLRDVLGSLRSSVVRLPSPPDAAAAVEDHRAYAFNPREVRAVVEAAATTEERLVILLFLTTGLRIGGLCRLRVAPPLLQLQRRPVAPRDVPTELSTVEKNGRVRRVRLCGTCRILVARWYEHGRHRGDNDGAAVASSPYLFPGVPHHHHQQTQQQRWRPVSTRHVWDVCHRVFVRAGVTGSHAHPHTFRHTVVRMLYCQGMTFEKIAQDLLL